MPTKTKEHASEGGHWYRVGEDGKVEQIASVPKAKGGGDRSPTLRDAKKAGDWLPGVTTICGQASAPGLTRWKMEQAALAALRNHKYVNDTDESWMARVLDDAAQIAKDAAEEGTRIHAAIEQYYRGESYDKNYRGHVLSVAELVRENCPSSEDQHPWLAEEAVAHPSWGYATKSDLFSEAWCLDWKGKDGNQETLEGLKTYESHWMQLAATRQAIDLKVPTPWKKQCAIVYVSRTHPGCCSFVEVTEEQLERGLAMFKALLDYWQAKNNYTPNPCF